MTASAIRRFALGGAITALVAVGASCGGGGDGGDDTGSGGSAPIEGEQIARSNGCAGCHGQDFGGAAGPGWIGLAGSEVELTDGTTIVVDDDYLTRAITDPAADVAAGYTLKMPANNLTDDEVAAIVAYINTLADE